MTNFRLQRKKLIPTSCVDKLSAKIDISGKFLQQPFPQQQLLPKNSQPLFSDLAKSLAGDGFSLVQRKNKLQRTLTHEIKDVNEDVLGVEVHNQQDSHRLIVPKKFHKVVGNKTESVKLKATEFPVIYFGVIIRDWIFNKHPNQIKDHTMESSNNKNINKELSTVNRDNHEKTSTYDGGT
ncbi:hypothetical protein HELRODRAFT_175769 [Helobdella robusta]|uniref:Uncharacterized protein n=1 Tax=Helobdella robusta TaxID=6412 RepID=T1F9M7_HELRO|nr:hypothetical protein HELRODRAFT_175769 [Helobdella robusta]ESO00359.1 hypothetical protein HELRODRAFT_175769 [Helobdella robusta]